MASKSTKGNYKIKVLINSTEIDMEIDNGAEKSLINAQTFKKLWPNEDPVWENRRPNLKAWEKKSIATKGIILVNIKYKGISKRLPVIVTSENNGPNLFGENWFKYFDIKVTGIHSIQADKSKYYKNLKKFPNLIKNYHGHSGRLINIELKDGAKPNSWLSSSRVEEFLIDLPNE